MFDIVLVGYGRIGEIHGKNIQHSSNFKLKYIIDNESRIEKIKKSILDDSIIITTNFEKALEDKNVSAVFICSPTHLHYSHIMESLKHDKHVFCEKPISDKIDEIEECFNYAESKNLKLFCALNRRFDNEICKLKTNISSIGNVNQLISITRDFPYPSIDFLKNSSGLFNDCALHDIDFINWILEDVPKFVYVSAKITKPIEISGGIIDDSCIHLEYSSGTRVFIYCSRISKTYDQRIEIIGEDGILEVKNPYGNITEFTDKKQNISFIDRYEESYKNELEYFYNLMVGREALLINKEECLNNLCIIHACNQSYETKSKIKIKYVEITNND